MSAMRRPASPVDVPGLAGRRRPPAPGNVANVAKPLIGADGEIAEQTKDTKGVDMGAVRRFEEHTAH